MNEKVRISSVLKTAGAFIAWVIGSGFATGQEVLQFFTSYGYKSYAVILINLIGFIFVGYFIMRTGYEHKRDLQFNHFKYFCGKTVGSFYMWLVVVTLLFLIPVLIAGAGATLYESYGIHTYIGSAGMAILVLAVYLIGFERMIKIVSSLGPLMIAFLVVVGVLTVCTDIGKMSNVAWFEDSLAAYHAAPHWLLSGLLYLGMTFFPGSTYFTQLGFGAASKKEVKYGAVIGATVLILSVTVISTAILLNGDVIVGLDIPVLYLARKISHVFGAVFSVMLVLGIFSSCSVVMWSVCSRFTFEKKLWNALLAIGVVSFSYVVSLCSFGKLISTVYPMIGYVGLFFIGCVVYKGIRRQK